MRSSVKAQTMPLNFLLSLLQLVIVIAALAFALSACHSRLFRVSNQAKQSFEKLGKTINDVADMQVGSRVEVPLYIDKGTVIIGFEKNTKKVSLEAAAEEDILRLRKKKWTIEYYARPDECPLTMSCLCLFRGIVTVQGTEPGTVIEKGQDITCKELSFDLIGYCKKKFKEGLEYIKCEGGFVIERASLHGFPGTPRSRTVFVENTKYGIALCEKRGKYGCLPEELVEKEQ